MRIEDVESELKRLRDGGFSGTVEIRFEPNGQVVLVLCGGKGEAGAPAERVDGAIE